MKYATVISGLLVAVLVGCQSEVRPADAACVCPTPSPTIPPHEHQQPAPFARYGSRLVAYNYKANDGTVIPHSGLLWDTLLGEPCSFLNFGGTSFCIPLAFVASYGRFADKQCTVPLALVSKCTTAPDGGVPTRVRLMNITSCGWVDAGDVRYLGQKLPSDVTIYFIDDALGCVEFPGGAGIQLDVYEVGDQIPLESFVSSTMIPNE